MNTQPINDNALMLFLAGESPSSCRARKNLYKVLEQQSLQHANIVEINVLEQPGVALEKRIFATPALVATRAEDVAVLYGDFSETGPLLSFLEGTIAKQ